MTLSPDDLGAGSAVLLLHAGVADRRRWRAQAPALADAGFRVVAPDLRGFGESPTATEIFSNVDDVVDLVDALGLATVSVVGSSFGG